MKENDLMLAMCEVRTLLERLLYEDNAPREADSLIDQYNSTENQARLEENRVLYYAMSSPDRVMLYPEVEEDCALMAIHLSGTPSLPCARFGAALISQGSPFDKIAVDSKTWLIGRVPTALGLLRESFWMETP